MWQINQRTRAIMVSVRSMWQSRVRVTCQRDGRDVSSRGQTLLHYNCEPRPDPRPPTRDLRSCLPKSQRRDASRDRQKNTPKIFETFVQKYLENLRNLSHYSRKVGKCFSVHFVCSVDFWSIWPESSDSGIGLAIGEGKWIVLLVNLVPVLSMSCPHQFRRLSEGDFFSWPFFRVESFTA